MYDISFNSQLGLHTILFQQKSLFSCLQTTLIPIRNALNRWQTAWEARTKIEEVGGREPWKNTGFIEQAHEFASLCVARIEALESPEQTVLNATGEPTKPASGLLDDTSMGLVMDLMLSLTVIAP